MESKVFVFVNHTQGRIDDSALELKAAAKTIVPSQNRSRSSPARNVDAVCR